MKRMTAMLLAIIMIVGLLASCGNTGGAAGGGASTNAGGEGQSANPLGDYPNKNIEVVLCHGPGSPLDAIEQMCFDFVEKDLGFGKSFTLSNREGSSGEVGLTYVQDQPHDGYTLVEYQSAHVTLDTTRAGAIDFSHKDFKPIVSFYNDVGCFFVSGSRKDEFPDLQSVVEAAKANPGKITVACSGPTSSSGRLVKALERMTGAQFQMVSVNNGTERNSMLIGGHVDIVCDQICDSAALVKDGSMSILAVSWDEPLADYPDVPTFKEQGYDIVQGFSIASLACPADIPDEIYSALVESFKKALEDPDIQAKGEELGLPLEYIEPEELAAIWDNIYAQNEEEWAVEPWL